ncbi:hypothetical protein BC629DRAFT_930343 [Irpex lacteus]|nr:hypothetical protein BC629DRAFT_930343 [Irpex lacteus]
MVTMCLLLSSGFKPIQGTLCGQLGSCQPKTTRSYNVFQEHCLCRRETRLTRSGRSGADPHSAPRAYGCEDSERVTEQVHDLVSDPGLYDAVFYRSLATSSLICHCNAYMDELWRTQDP